MNVGPLTFVQEERPTQSLTFTVNECVCPAAQRTVGPQRPPHSEVKISASHRHLEGRDRCIAHAWKGGQSDGWCQAQ